MIIDAMSLVQKIKGNHETFKEVAETLFCKAMSEKGSCNRVGLVFDVYKQKSIKMLKGETEVILFLFCSVNKTNECFYIKLSFNENVFVEAF